LEDANDKCNLQPRARVLQELYGSKPSKRGRCWKSSVRGKPRVLVKVHEKNPADRRGT